MKQLIEKESGIPAEEQRLVSGASGGSGSTFVTKRLENTKWKRFSPVQLDAIGCNWPLFSSRSTEMHKGQDQHKKNKMKPTNPNADTYVDKQRQYLFVTFPTNSLVRRPEFTH